MQAPSTHGALESSNSASFKLKATVALDISARQIDTGIFQVPLGVVSKVLIPDGIKKLDAYVEGTAEIKIKNTLKKGLEHSLSQTSPWLSEKQRAC